MTNHHPTGKGSDKIKIKIALSVDKKRNLIKILAESHMAFDWEIKSTFDRTQTDRLALALTLILSLSFANALKEVVLRSRPGLVCLSVCNPMSML